MLPGCNNACLLVFFLEFSRIHCPVLTFAQYQTLYRRCYSLTHRAQYSGDPENCFRQTAAEIRCEVTVQ